VRQAQRSRPPCLAITARMHSVPDRKEGIERSGMYAALSEVAVACHSVFIAGFPT